MSLYGPLVWTIVRRYARNFSDAEDAAQDIFLCIWQSADRFDPMRGCPDAFVATIARRRMIDSLRRHYARGDVTKIPLEWVDEELLDDDVGCGERDCDSQVALEALSRLRPAYRQVLELSFQLGLTQTEIAARLSMPHGTVKSYMRRGLLAVRAALKADVESANAGQIVTSTTPNKVVGNARRARTKSFPSKLGQRVGQALDLNNVPELCNAAPEPEEFCT